jgi:hypothetical protein
MKQTSVLVVGLLAAAAGLFLSIAVASAQQAPKYPLDDKLASEPAPWAVPGKWGKHGNWGRWGEDDKRGMLNYLTPELVAFLSDAEPDVFDPIAKRDHAVERDHKRPALNAAVHATGKGRQCVGRETSRYRPYLFVDSGLKGNFPKPWHA